MFTQTFCVCSAPRAFRELRTSSRSVSFFANGVWGKKRGTGGAGGSWMAARGIATRAPLQWRTPGAAHAMFNGGGARRCAPWAAAAVGTLPPTACCCGERPPARARARAGRRPRSGVYGPLEPALPGGGCWRRAALRSRAGRSVCGGGRRRGPGAPYALRWPPPAPSRGRWGVRPPRAPGKRCLIAPLPCLLRARATQVAPWASGGGVRRTARGTVPVFCRVSSCGTLPCALGRCALATQAVCSFLCACAPP